MTLASKKYLKSALKKLGPQVGTKWSSTMTGRRRKRRKG